MPVLAGATLRQMETGRGMNPGTHTGDSTAVKRRFTHVGFLGYGGGAYDFDGAAGADGESGSSVCKERWEGSGEAAGGLRDTAGPMAGGYARGLDGAGRGGSVDVSYLRWVGASAEWQVSAGAGAGRCGDAAVPGACDLYGAFAENGHGDL